MAKLVWEKRGRVPLLTEQKWQGEKPGIKEGKMGEGRGNCEENGKG